MHLLLRQLGDFLARFRADRLDRRATLAEHDLALTLALHIDRLLDAHGAVAQLLPRLRLDRRLIWQFLMQPIEQLLAGNLGREAAHRRVGNLILRVMPWSYGRVLREPRL